MEGKRMANDPVKTRMMNSPRLIPREEVNKYRNSWKTRWETDPEHSKYDWDNIDIIHVHDAPRSRSVELPAASHRKPWQGEGL